MVSRLKQKTPLTSSVLEGLPSLCVAKYSSFAARSRSSGTSRRNHMKDEPLTTIEREVKGWPGVTTGDTGRGGLQFSYGRVELGHLHGSSFADLPFPKKVRNELIAQGRASVHPPLPNSGWVRRRMYAPEDVEAVIGLFRINYDRARARDERRAGRRVVSGDGK